MHAFPNASLTPLFHTERGYALWCACCNRLQLVYGNVVLTQDVRGVELFRHLIESLDLAEPNFHLPGGRGFAVTLQDISLAYAFTREEVLELRELLAGTFAMLDLRSLLQQTLNPDARQ